jgi:hypothetical protein
MDDREPEHNRRFRWLIEVEVNEVWVADGFDFDEDRCDQVRENLIGYADPDEVQVRVVKTPSPVEIRQSQGYTIEPSEFFAPEPDGGFTKVVELKRGDRCYRKPLDDDDEDDDAEDPDDETI